MKRDHSCMISGWWQSLRRSRLLVVLFVCFAFVVLIDQSTVWKIISNLQGVSIPYPPPPLMKGVEIPRGRGLLRERSGNNTRWTDIHCVTTKTLCLHSTLFCNLSSWLKIQVCYLISSLYSCNSWSLLSLSVLVCKQALHLWLLVNSPNWELDRKLKLSWITHFIRLFSLLFSLQLFRVGPIPSPFLL